MISARINRACRSSRRANVDALLIDVNYSDEALSRDCRHHRGLGVTTWGGYIFLFSALFSFLLFFFHSLALSGARCSITAAGDTWRRLFSSRIAVPVRLAAPPRSQSVDLSNRTWPLVWRVQSHRSFDAPVSWGSRKSGDAPRAHSSELGFYVIFGDRHQITACLDRE